MYLTPRNIPSATVLTLGNKVALYLIVTDHGYMPNSLSCCFDTRSHTFGAYKNVEQALSTDDGWGTWPVYFAGQNGKLLYPKL